MALFNESLEGRFNRGVARIHNIKGIEPARQVSPELQHIIPIDNYEADNWAIFDKWPWAARVSAGPFGAGTFAYYAIVNPANSGILVVVEHIAIMPSMAGSTVALGVARPPLGLSNNGTTGSFFRDGRSRSGLLGGGPIVISTGSLLTTPFSVVENGTGQNTAERPEFKSVPWVLTPGGDNVILWNTASNGLIELMCCGFFRPLSPGDSLA